jgi:hypothetical protein
MSQGEARFQFDRERASSLVAAKLGRVPRRVAAREFPFPLPESDLAGDRELVEELLAEGAVTVIRLPLRAQIAAEQVERTIRETLRPEVLLFMPGTRELESRLGSPHERWRRRPGRRLKVGRVMHVDGTGRSDVSWVVRDVAVPVSAGEAHALNDPAWENVQWSGGDE